MNRCLLYSLFHLVFSFILLLFPIPTICTSYTIYFKLESYKNGSEVYPCPKNGVEANCSVGRAVQYLPSDAADMPIQAYRKALRNAIMGSEKPKMMAWTLLVLRKEGDTVKLTVDDTLLSRVGVGVGVGGAAVECEFSGLVRVRAEEEEEAKLSSMKVRVLDVEWNPRFGGDEEVVEAWEVTTWVLKPVFDAFSNRIRYTWFLKKGAPEEEPKKLYNVVTWNRKNDMWPSTDILVKGSPEAYTRLAWLRIKNGTSGKRVKPLEPITSTPPHKKPKPN